MQVQFPLDQPRPAEEALVMNGRLPGNVRFACTGGRMVLLADVPIVDRPQLVESFAEIRRGFQDALGDGETDDDPPGEPVSADEVEKALGESGLEKDDMVRLDRGWEIRPRIRGEVVGVLLTIEDTGVRLSCQILPALTDACNPQVLAMHALRISSQLRYARLATAGEAMVAETRLHPGLIRSRFLKMTARAVAVAFEHTHVGMEILAREGDVAGYFKEMFGCA